MRSERQRWVNIGLVKTDCYIGNSQWRGLGGLFLDYQCKAAWCAPREFFHWHELLAAVKHLVRLRGLVVVAMRCLVRRVDGWVQLQVQAAKDSRTPIANSREETEA